MLLHGAMADNRDWHLQLADLARDFTVVAWDAPGCGGSFDPPDDFGLAYAGWAGSLGREEAERRRRWGHSVADLPPRQVATDFAATLFTEEVPRQIVQGYLELMTDFRPVGVRAMANALADADLREVLPGIDVPTLIVHGDADQRAPLRVAQELHVRIPGSKLVVSPGSGHMVTLEAPERVNDEVRSFLGA